MAGGMDMEEKLFQYLRCVAYQMRHHADAKGGQGWILAILLHRERIPQREMQNLLGIQAGSLSEILSKLEGRGLISRSPNEEDRRSMDIVLTEKGSRIAQETEVFRRLRRESLFQALSEEEKLTLAALLEKLLVDWNNSFEKARGGYGYGRGGHGCHMGRKNHGNQGGHGDHGHHEPHGGHGHHSPHDEEDQP